MRICILFSFIFFISTLHAQLNEHVIDASFKQFVNYLHFYDNEILIDVRPSETYEDMGFKDAVSIPTKKQLEQFADTTDMHLPILVYCDEGYRSIAACNLLFDLGFVTVINLKSGIEHKLKAIKKFNQKN